MDTDGNGQITWDNPRYGNPAEAYTDANGNGVYDFGAWSLGAHWEPLAPAGPWVWAFKMRVTSTPFGAVNAILPLRGECAGAMHMCLLLAAADAMGAPRFNAVHGTALYVGYPWTSFNKHIYAGTDTETFVPGDRTYFKNKMDYSDHTLGGYWQGENMVYDGVDAADGKAKFTGLGDSSKSEDYWRDQMKDHYNNDTRAEPYTDTNGNGSYDAGEPFNDWNANGIWDRDPPDIAEPEPYTDTNGNAKWDVGEPYTDVDGDGAYSSKDVWIRFESWHRIKTGD